MDAFREQFERFATGQDWPEDSRAASLNPLLTGKALDVYESMPAHPTKDYTSLKRAALHH